MSPPSLDGRSGEDNRPCLPQPPASLLSPWGLPSFPRWSSDERSTSAERPIPLVRPSSKEEDTRPNTCSIEMDPQSSRWDTTPGRVSVNLASSSPLRVLWLGAQVIPGGRKTRGAGTGRRLLIHGPPTMSRPNRPGATALDEAREGNLSQPSRTPPLSAFTPEELRIIRTYRTPAQVQDFLRRLPYNWERGGKTLRSFRGVIRHGEANCLEAVLAAATILEQHGYPPLVLDLVSQAELDHVAFLFKHRGRWGAVAKSRDPGLHGRKPVFRRIRDLVYSYVDPYVDGSGRIVGYGVGHLDALVRADWRLGRGNMWEVERALLRMPHKELRTSDRRYLRMLRRFLALTRAGHPLTPKALRELYGPAVARWL